MQKSNDVTQEWNNRARELVLNSSDPKVTELLKAISKGQTINISYLKKFGKIEMKRIKGNSIFKDYLNGKFYLIASYEGLDELKDFEISKIASITIDGTE